MDILREYAMSFVGTPYSWGGDDAIDGYDCSGFVQELLQSVGEDPKGDQTAQGLFNYFSENGHGSQLVSIKMGTLLFFRPHDDGKITHVAMALDPYRMIEAGGGGKETLTRVKAAEHNAYVRIRPINSRKDLVSHITPYYRNIGCY